MSRAHPVRQKWPTSILLWLPIFCLFPAAAHAQMPPNLLHTFVGTSTNTISGCSDPGQNQTFRVNGSLEVTDQTGAAFTAEAEFLSSFAGALVRVHYAFTGTSTDDGILSGTSVAQTFLDGQHIATTTPDFSGCTGGPTCESAGRSNDPSELTIVTEGGPTGAGGCVNSGATLRMFTCGNGMLDFDLDEDCDDGNRTTSSDPPDCCTNDCRVPLPETTLFFPLLGEETCAPTGEIGVAADEVGAVLELRCDENEEFRTRHRFPPRGFDKDVSRSPYAGSLNFETIGAINVVQSFNPPESLECAQSLFWRAREPRTLNDPAGCTPGCSGDYCQGTCDVADWVTFRHDVNLGMLRCEHFTSPDGPGGSNDQRVRVEIDCDVSTFPTADLARVTVADPMIADMTFPCDNDYDDDCDLADYDAINDSIGLCSDMGPFNEPADTDHDGCITQADLARLYPAPEPAAAPAAIAALSALFGLSRSLRSQRRQKRG